MSSISKKPIAIICSDLHISVKPPIFRSNEEDWFEAQARPLRQIKAMQKKLDIPVLCCGDIFDRWNTSPEGINFAMKELPSQMFCIPGQHDLPAHNLKEIHKSAYWTLVEACVIKHVTKPIDLGSFVLHGFPFGTSLEDVSLPLAGEYRPRIAIIHEYLATPSTAYPEAPKECMYDEQSARYDPWDLVAYGDNHKSFLRPTDNDGQVLNTGSPIIRKKDEDSNSPVFAIVYMIKQKIMKVEWEFLVTYEDSYYTTKDLPETTDFDMQNFLASLTSLGTSGIDFEDALERHFRTHHTKKDIRQIITSILEEHTHD